MEKTNFKIGQKVRFVKSLEKENKSYDERYKGLTGTIVDVGSDLIRFNIKVDFEFEIAYFNSKELELVEDLEKIKYPSYCKHCDPEVFGCEGCYQNKKTDSIPNHYWEKEKQNNKESIKFLISKGWSTKL